jgi:hypothetical protein
MDSLGAVFRPFKTLKVCPSILASGSEERKNSGSLTIFIGQEIEQLMAK